MAHLFEIRDSTNRTIYLTQERWEHISEHPEISDGLEQIKETIILPTSILYSPRDEKVHYCFRFYKGSRKYLLVAVKYLNGKGYVITAYLTTKRAV